MYKIVTQQSGDNFGILENIINEDHGHILFVTSNEHRLIIVYEIPDRSD